MFYLLKVSHKVQPAIKGKGSKYTLGEKKVKQFEGKFENHDNGERRALYITFPYLLGTPKYKDFYIWFNYL